MSDMNASHEQDSRPAPFALIGAAIGGATLSLASYLVGENIGYALILGSFLGAIFSKPYALSAKRDRGAYAFRMLSPVVFLLLYRFLVLRFHPIANRCSSAYGIVMLSSLILAVISSDWILKRFRTKHKNG